MGSIKIGGKLPVTRDRIKKFPFLMARYLATVRNKKVIDSERVQGHYLPVTSMVLGKGGRDDLGERMF
jgi:hypothetical protein